MFTSLAIKNFAGSVLSFLWEYKWSILIGALLAFLWIRGNHYQQKYEQETVAHKQERAEHLVTRIENELTLKQLQADSETALRLAQEKSLRDYQSLVEKTTQIQKEYSVREKEINNTISSLNSSNARLSETIKQYTTTTNSSTNSNREEGDTSSKRLSTLGGLLEACTAEYIYMGTEASKLGNSVNTLKSWGDNVVDSVNKNVNVGVNGKQEAVNVAD